VNAAIINYPVANGTLPRIFLFLLCDPARTPNN
jgi:hypothetical protein